MYILTWPELKWMPAMIKLIDLPILSNETVFKKELQDFKKLREEANIYIANRNITYKAQI